MKPCHMRASSQQLRTDLEGPDGDSISTEVRYYVDIKPDHNHDLVEVGYLRFRSDLKVV